MDGVLGALNAALGDAMNSTLNQYQHNEEPQYQYNVHHETHSMEDLVAASLHEGVMTSQDWAFETALQTDHRDATSWAKYIAHRIQTLHEKYSLKTTTTNPKEVLAKEYAMYSSELTPLIYLLYERALLAIPASKLLWTQYLDFRVQSLYTKSLVSLGNNGKSDVANWQPELVPRYTLVNPHVTEAERLSQVAQINALENCFVRALTFCSDSPEIWVKFADFNLYNTTYIPGSPLKAKRILNEALRSVEVLYHSQIWDRLLKLATVLGRKPSIKIWLRYLKFKPESAELASQVLTRIAPEYPSVPACILIQLLSDVDYQSVQGMTKYQLSLAICDLLIKDAAIVYKNMKLQYGEVDENIRVIEGGRRRMLAGLVAGQRKGVNSDSVEVLNIMKLANVDNDVIDGLSAQLDGPAVILALIGRFTDQVARLWNKLAEYYIVQKDFEQARGVYERAIDSVTTVQDFAILFDAYSTMEEKIATFQLSQFETRKKRKLDDDEEQDEEEEEEFDESGEQEKLDMYLGRLERLTERRPFLVNEVLLRQNVSNVEAWLHKVELHLENSDKDAFAEQKAVETFEEAVTKMKYNVLRTQEIVLFWLTFSNFFKERDDNESAILVLDRGIEMIGNTYNVEAVVDLICLKCEFYLERDQLPDAMKTLMRFTTPSQRIQSNKQLLNSIKYSDYKIVARDRLFKSVKLWGMYADLEENKCTEILERKRANVGSDKQFVYLDSTEIAPLRAVYDRILDLKIATVQTIINYASVMGTCGWIEDSFKIFERGINLFGYPVAFEIWNVYIPKFIKYAESKRTVAGMDKIDIERTRDLFEQALSNCPDNLNVVIYLEFFKFEIDFSKSETRGLKILRDAAGKVQPSDRTKVIDTLLAKTYELRGAIALREVYELALEVLPDSEIQTYCKQFAELEVKLGELDRAKAVLAYAAECARR